MSLNGIKFYDKIAQISFNSDADPEVIKRQLEYVKEKYPNYRFIVAFLSRKHLEEKNLDTSIVDLLDRELEGRLEYATSDYETYDEVMSNISNIRESIKHITDKMFVLGSNLNPGVAQEIEFQSNGRIVFVT